MADISVDGVIRRCLTQANPAGHQTPLKAFAEVHPLFTNDQLRSILANPNRVPSRQRFDKTWILDQKSYGSCEGHAEAGALQRTRIRRGFQDKILLSGGYAYSKVNGGNDNGAALEDGLKAIQQFGICPLSLVTADMIYPHLQPANADAEAAKHKASVAYHLPDWQNVLSALAADFDIIVAISAGQHYSNTSHSTGMAGVDNGSGNHAVCCDDYVEINGEFWVDSPGSWNTGLGIDGRVFLSQGSFQQTIQHHTFYAVASMNEAGQ